MSVNPDSIARLEQLVDASREVEVTAWICDVNGVLVDSTALVREAFAATGARHGFSFTDDDFQNVKGLPLADAYRILDPGGDQLRRREFHVGYLREHLARVRTYPDVPETLAAAKAAGVRVGAATSCGEIAEACLVNTGLYRFIDCLVTQEEVTRCKPHPESILRILALFGIDEPYVRTAVHVGDSPFDVEAGRAAGVRTIGVTYGVSGPTEMAAARPEGLIHSFGQMHSSFLAQRTVRRRMHRGARTLLAAPQRRARL